MGKTSRTPSLAVVAAISLCATTSTVAVCAAQHWREMSAEAALLQLADQDPAVAGLAARRLTAVALDALRYLQAEAARDDERGAEARLMLSRIREAAR